MSAQNEAKIGNKVEEFKVPYEHYEMAKYQILRTDLTKEQRKLVQVVIDYFESAQTDSRSDSDSDSDTDSDSSEDMETENDEVDITEEKIPIEETPKRNFEDRRAKFLSCRRDLF